MNMRQATPSDINRIKRIAEVTISEIYPHYYPKGAVDFFLEHHSEDNILSDVKKALVYLCFDASQNAVGTITIKENEICRLFVLPFFQNRGIGTKMLDFAEKNIFQHHSKAVLDASLPAKKLYIKRGYKNMEFHIIATRDNDFLCYDVMEKQA